MSSWRVLVARVHISLSFQMGHDLYYVGVRPRGGIAETFFRLFEEFPKSKEFFTK